MVQAPEKRSPNGTATAVKTRSIAICGTAGTSRQEILALAGDVEPWGLNQCWNWMPKAARWFELHDPERYPHAFPEAHEEWLRQTDIPVVMQRRFEDIPQSEAFPLDRVTEGGRLRPYFTSTIAYMLAYAIAERPDEIRILGVDMAMDSEYEYQRAACEYWIGVAEAKGIRVYIPERSPLGKGIRYGLDPALTDSRRDILDWRDQVKQQRENMMAEFINTTHKALEDLRLNLAGCEGARQMTDRILRQGEGAGS